MGTSPPRSSASPRPLSPCLADYHLWSIPGELPMITGMGELSQPPDLPDHRRRRRLIAATGLVLLSLCVLWYWPRHDARLVGTWARAQADTLGDNVFEFHADGSGSCGSAGASGSPFHWIVRGSQLKLIYGQQPGWEGVIDRLNHLIGSPSLMYEGQIYEISEVSRDRKVWRLQSPGQRITAEGDAAFEVDRVR